MSGLTLSSIAWCERSPGLARTRAVRIGSATVGAGAGAELAGGVRRSTRARPSRAETVCRQGGETSSEIEVISLDNSF